LNKKNIDNYQKQEKMQEEAIESQVYQWLKTERAGEYVHESTISEEDGETWIMFTDGTRGNANLLGEYFIKVEDEDDGYIIKEEIIEDLSIAKTQDGKEIEVPGIMHGHRKINMTKKPRKRTPKKAEPVVKHSPEPTVAKKELTTDPVIILLEKAKKEKHSYEIELNVDAISKDLFGVVKDTFEEGEEKALDYIVSLIDMEQLKSQLKEKLKEVYNGKGNSI